MSLLGATVGLITGNQQAKAAEGAANAQKKAASAATQVERERLAMEYQQYQQQMQEYQRRQAINEQQMAQTIQNLAPYMQGGQAALYEMMALTGMAAPQGATAPTAVSTPMGGLRGTAQAAPTAPTTSGRMGIMGGLAGTVAPTPATIGGGTPAAMSPAAAEFGKGGLSLSSSRWTNVAPGASPRAEAAQMYQQVAGEMPGASEADIQAEAINRLNTQAAAASMPTVPTATSPYAGMTGAEAQQTAMGGLAASPYSYQSLSSAEGLRQIAESPLLQALAQQGETGILQNAAATGGLRGGRTQAALAQFRPQQMQEELMRRYTTGQSELANQYARLQGLSGLGQQSILAAPTMQAGPMPTMNYASNIPQLMLEKGAAQAGGILGQAAPFTSAVNTAMQLAGTAGGLAMGLPGGAGLAGTTAPAYSGLGIGNPSAYTF